MVIPVKDDDRELAACLASLAAQWTPPTEIIVVDNGSSDHSAAVARGFDATLVTETRPGIAAAAATGYDHATGDIIARLDADCVAPLGWTDRISSAFADDRDLTGITGGAVFHDGPRSLRRIGPVLYLGAYFVSMSAALGHVPLFGSNCAFRRSDWLAVRDDVHRSDLLVHDDVDLAVHLGPHRRIRFDPKLRMEISSRPLSEGFEGTVLRARRGVHSLTIHWPDAAPHRRLIERIRSR